MPQTQVTMPDGSVKIFNLPDGATKAQIEDFLNSQSSPAPQSVADVVRQRLRDRGLTPEGVKKNGFTAPLPGDTGEGTPVMRSIAQGLGIPTSAGELGKFGLNVATAGASGAADQAVGMIQDAMSGHIPIVGRPIEALAAPAGASMANRPQTPSENAGAIQVAAGTIPALAMASPAIRGAVGSMIPEGEMSMQKTASNLINRWLGDGAIDTTMGKDAGRGISRGKIVAATADGVQAKVQGSIAEGQATVKRLLDTPAAKTPSIDGNQLIRDAFGEPPLNITGATLGRWEEFAGNIAKKIHEITEGTMQLTPAQVDGLKGEIDVNFGKPTTGVVADPTELNLNQKAGAVRRTFDHAVDQQVPGYAELNDHLGDLHHANKLLDKKIAENSTAPPLSLNPKALIRGTMADAVSQGGSKGTRPGLLTTPGRTALAAMLSERPSFNTVSPVPAGPPSSAAWLDNLLSQYGQPRP